MKAEARQQNLFSTPVIAGRIDDEDLRAALEEVILTKRQTDAGIKRSNVGGWHSDTQMLQWGGDPARRLAAKVIEFANAHTQRVDGDKPLRWAVEAWANVNDKGSANARHIHGGCYWSAVYYVRTDEDSKAALIFYDPRMPTLAMHAPKLRFRQAGGERVARLKPEPGRVLIFPSWLEHEVEASQGEGLRISIAINLIALPDAPGLPKPKPAAVAAAPAPALQQMKETQ